MTWYLRDSNSAGAPDIAPFQYGAPGWRPVAGDWTGIGRGGIGVIDPSGVWYLRDSNSAGAPDVAPFAYGLGGWTPLAGTWRPAASPAAAHSARAAQAVDPLSAEALGLGADLAPLADPGAAARRGQALDRIFSPF
jgi:hypothetical protein